MHAHRDVRGFCGYLLDLQPSHVNASQLMYLIVSAYNGRQIFFLLVLQHEKLCEESLFFTRKQESAW